jgi:hypothetical protein
MSSGGTRSSKAHTAQTLAVAGAAMPPSRGSRDAHITRVAWIPEGELDHREWLAAGHRLGMIGRCSQWWIGDWIRYGNSRWGEKYAHAARVTGYDPASLRNMAWVAARVELSLRSDKLTWSHHVLVAPFEPHEQRRWLATAITQKLSVADLRVELRAAAGSDKRTSDTEAQLGVVAELRADRALVCPNCGHDIVVSGAREIAAEC